MRGISDARDMRRLPLALLFAAAPAVAGPMTTPIVGGTPTNVGDYPSVVVLEVGQGLCTGTLITSEWVMTAAHCVTPEVVGVGTQAELTMSTRVHFGTVNLGTSAGTVVHASDTIPDPAFNINNLGSGDSGLIHLATPVTNVAPVPVNLVGTKAPVGMMVTEVGFGAIHTGNPPSGVGVEYKVNQTAVSCQSFGAGSDVNLLCYNQTNGTGKCEGDSGGPSFAMVDGMMKQVGITSFGDQTCEQFGADTRTDAEMAFLLQHVPDLKPCTTDNDCSTGGICFKGACLVAPFGPMGLGTMCTSGADCQSGQCASGPGGQKCTMGCTPDADGTCPAGFECLSNGASGDCWPGTGDSGGCCDSGNHGAPTMVLGIALVGLCVRRRRR
jgi:hypothetical protein